MPGNRNAWIRLGLRSVTATFFILGALLLLGRHWVTFSWPSTLGTVERVAVTPVGDPEDSRAPGEQFRPSVGYRYTVEGAEYTGNQITVFDWVYRSEARVRDLLADADVRNGGRVPVYYDPDDPETAVLVRSVPWHRLEVILGLLFMVALPIAVVFFSIVDVVRGGASRRDDGSRGRMW
ncbi:MAG: DUF3592 domain-containing protein [Spirochaeta sp.]|jgi:hypothetical protein|nr:DUF3592 domain-containing protein [Spirochaeta sp.]